MPYVVFLRGANVGGKNVFRPAQLARELAHLDVVNIGAAGTFVVRGNVSATAIRSEIRTRLPFELTLCVRPAREIMALVRSDPFKGVGFSKTRRGWVGVLSRRARARPTLPVIVSAGNEWVLRIEHVDGVFVRGLWRLRRGGFVIPANEVERALGVAATVRWWETFERIARAME
jgi:uncharacterized protein (DUF1697 family)